MRIIQKTIYKLDELPSDIQQAIIDEARNGDDLWYSGDVISHILNCARRIFGEDIDLLFNGFYEQGDGACFAGVARWNEFKDIDFLYQEEWLTIAHKWVELQSEYDGQLVFELNHSDRYCHEHSVTVTCVDFPNFDTTDIEKVESIQSRAADILRDAMRLAYKTLQDDYEHATSDAAIREYIIANGFEYDETGAQA